jgi:hypothetical protein
MTTTTLLRELPTELEVLLWSGQLRKIRFNEYSALKLLSNAVCCIRNAKTRDFSAVGRFFMACEGIHSLCLGVTYLHGLLPAGLVGHRSMVIQVGCEMLHLPLPIRDQIMYANTHQELITYGSTEPVEEGEALGLVLLGDKAVEQARYIYPDWFL